MIFQLISLEIVKTKKNISLIELLRILIYKQQNTFYKYFDAGASLRKITEAGELSEYYMT